MGRQVRFYFERLSSLIDDGTVAKNIIPVTLSTTQDNIKRHIEGFVKASQTLTVADIAKLDGIAAAGKQNRVVMPPWGMFLCHVTSHAG